jgi:hypothetical protein
MDLMKKFKLSYLTEAPVDLGKGQSSIINVLRDSIRGIIDYHYEPIKINANYYKLELEALLYYWYQNDRGEIILAIELERKPLALIVRLLGKRKDYSGKNPFAIDLFEVIFNDKHKNIRFLSDESMTIDGFNNWSRLLDKGYKISVYDREKPGSTFKPFKNKEEMEIYFDSQPNFKRYQYILSESNKNVGNLIGEFCLRRYRELTHMEHEDF